MSSTNNYRVLYAKSSDDEKVRKFYSARDCYSAFDMFKDEYAYCNDGASFEDLNYCVVDVETCFGWIPIWDVSRDFKNN
jgi:hypothetical protein